MVAEVSGIESQEWPLAATLLRLASSESTIKIITQGRISKLPHIVRVRFILSDGEFYVLPGAKSSDWVLNALSAGIAKIRLENLVITTVVSETSETETAKTISRFTAKYGRRVVSEWYSTTPTALQLRPQGTPTWRATVRGEGETTISFEDWLTEDKKYYESVSAAFDSASEEYDFTISHNYVNTWIRKRSISELLGLVKPDDILIEVGCGTGAEALEIAQHVSRIIATDISEKMLDILRRKIEARGLANKILPFQVRAADLSRLSNVLNGGMADAVYSFNGALNCEPDIRDFVEGLASILRAEGYFVCSVRNSLCIGEALSHAAVMQFERMAPRKRQPVMVSVGGIDIPAYYYSASAFAKFFVPHLKLRKIIGLPTFVPPAYLSDYYVKFKAVGSVLEKLEYVLGDHFPFNRLGDQTLFVFQKSN